MNQNELIKRVQALQWERWLERPFHAFLGSLFEDSGRRESYESIGVAGVELEAQLYQHDFWYCNHEAFDKMDRLLEKYLRNHTIFDITDSLAKFRVQSIERIEELKKSKQPTQEKFAEVYNIIKNVPTYIWLAHGLEAYYNRRLQAEVPKYVSGDVDKFIGDASFPKKKNAHAKLDELLRTEISVAEIARQFGWVKIRDGFSDPFSEEDLQKMRQELAPLVPHTTVEIPPALTSLFNEVQELVFFRTERTDVLSQLLYLARPIIKEMGDEYDIPFSDLRYYRARSLAQGKLEKFNPMVTFAYIDQQVIFQNDPIVATGIDTSRGIKGAIAHPGKVQGVVKIVRNTSQLDKVLPGDILVTQMTFPSFVAAMNRAAAFVTDEGGITCHAAIVAREMHKPCVIGTKTATTILKDGDLVEVDADQGVVKIIKSLD